jgi:NAD(P)-dependent dehydrogenase (short-subunit alcohol dehydrogenase family)
MMTNEMAGKVALVTGAASGIGRVTAQYFGQRGASVVVTTDANIAGAEQTVNSITQAGGRAWFIKCDVSKADEVEALVAETVRIYGSLDYAFNNAGIGPDGVRVPIVPIKDYPEDVWDRTIDVNLKGPFLCLKYEISQMVKQGHGAIVNTSSAGGLKGVPNFAAYVASKAGLIGLTKTAALECAELGVRVNVILPGPTERTRLVDNFFSSHPEEEEHMRQIVPMRRLGRPEEMAEAVIWLCSDAASFVTGHVMTVDGGMTSL